MNIFVKYRYIFLIFISGFSANLCLYFSDYVIWDSWHSYFFLKNPDQINFLYRFLADAGRPLDFTFYIPFSFFGDPVSAVKFISVGIWMLTWILVYRTLQVLLHLHKINSFYISLIAASLPYFELIGEICLFMNVLCIFIFYIAWQFYILSLNKQIWKSIFFRLSSVFLFFISFNFNSLLVIYYVFFIGWFYKSCSQDKFAIAFLCNKLFKKIDFLLIPVLFWYLKNILTPTSGYYAETSYNSVRLDLGLWSSGALTSLKTVKSRITDLLDSPMIFLIIITLAFCFYFFTSKVAKTKTQESPKLPETFFILAFGSFLLAASIFPYIAVGKPIEYYGYETRHGILLALPVAMIVYGFISLIRQTLLSGNKAFISVSCLFVCVAGVIESNKNILRLQGLGAKQWSLIPKLEKLTEIPNVNAINVRDYYFMSRSIPWFPAISWTYMISFNKALPTAIVVDTRNFLPDQYTHQPDGSKKLEIPLITFNSNDIDSLCKITSIPYALKNIPRNGVTINAAVFPGGEGDNPILIGTRYLKNKYFEPIRMKMFLENLTKVIYFTPAGQSELK